MIKKTSHNHSHFASNDIKAAASFTMQTTGLPWSFELGPAIGKIVL
jgi:hypothetical protein